MEHYKMRRTVTFLIISFLYMSCWNNDKQEGFYDYSRISYIYRLPVIEPYEITSPDNGANWTIAFKSSPPPAHGVQFLTNIGIRGSVFVVYSPRDLSFSSDHPQVWAVIDISKKTEKIFTKEAEYYAYLKSIGLKDIKLYDINEVFVDFDKNKKLPLEWIKK